MFSECHKVFTLVVRGAKELKEKLLSFVIIDEVDKTSYLQTLCMQIALVGRIADAVRYIHIFYLCGMLLSEIHMCLLIILSI